MTDQAFAAVAHLPVYIHDGASRLQRFLRETTGQTDLIVAPEDVTVRSRHAVKATAPQWEIVEYLKGRLPDTNIVFREHLLSSKRQERAEVLTTFGALVTKRLGPFVLRREYLVDPYRLVATDTTMNCRTS